jgi:hypothetical protein
MIRIRATAQGCSDATRGEREREAGPEARARMLDAVLTNFEAARAGKDDLRNHDTIRMCHGVVRANCITFAHQQ